MLATLFRVPAHECGPGGDRQRPATMEHCESCIKKSIRDFSIRRTPGVGEQSSSDANFTPLRLQSLRSVPSLSLRRDRADNRKASDTSRHRA
jgi:hypothetical protein